MLKATAAMTAFMAGGLLGVPSYDQPLMYSPLPVKIPTDHASAKAKAEEKRKRKMDKRKEQS